MPSSTTAKPVEIPEAFKIKHESEDLEVLRRKIVNLKTALKDCLDSMQVWADSDDGFPSVAYNAFLKGSDLWRSS